MNHLDVLLEKWISLEKCFSKSAPPPPGWNLFRQPWLNTKCGNITLLEDLLEDVETDSCVIRYFQRLCYSRFVLPNWRSRPPEVFCEKGVLKHFTKFTGKQLCQSLFLIKFQVQICNFIKNETLTQLFFYEFCEIFKNSFFMEHLRYLRL